MLIDPGLLSVFDHLATCLNSIGVSPEAIDTIVLTYEHLDHLGAVSQHASHESKKRSFASPWQLK